jgi:hypothetical protein
VEAQRAGIMPVMKNLRSQFSEKLRTESETF